jgi:phosphoglycolate phosphatase
MWRLVGAAHFQMPFQNVQAILFDLDGTLIHSRIDFDRMRAMVADMAESCGIQREHFKSKDVLGMLEEACASVQDPDSLRAKVNSELIAIELEATDNAVEAEEASSVMEWLRESGIKVGIVTRNSPQAVGRMLMQIPLPHEVLLTRVDTPRVKPDPLHLHLALERLQVRPAEGVMVGDHLMDIQGGKAAGMRTLGILTPDRPRDFFDAVEPDGVIQHLNELRTWISP